MLEIRSLCVTYNGHEVLKEISLDIASGEILAVIGPNGAGKTTLIRAISGVASPRSGSIRIGNIDLVRLTPMQRARYLAVVPQARELPPAYTVHETVLLGRTPYMGWLGHAGLQDQETVRTALQHTQTDGLSQRHVGKLSGGEQQRVLLARALAQDTPILLLDEPTTHLDLEHQAGFLTLVQRLAVQKDLAVMIVLHDLNLASLYANRVALLVNGRIQMVGSPGEVLTSENLSRVYRVPVNVIEHPEYGTPLVLPDGRTGQVFH